ncbi:MAG: class I SAM-dependent methyltransferase [Gammaproteobacteria bacterium]
MSCCCPHARSASRLFSFAARRYRRRFERHGFERSQQQLMAGLALAGFGDARVLEIGSGVGHLHQSLVEQGAASAVGIDLAPRMIDEARRWAADRGLAERTRYLEGDFMTLAPEVPAADVVVLDKVVCCYPDADGLVHRSLEKAGRVYALTYPRDRWYVGLGAALATGAMKLVGSDFRPYVHQPERVEAWVRDAGFRKCHEATTPIWLTQVFVRP